MNANTSKILAAANSLIACIARANDEELDAVFQAFATYANDSGEPTAVWDALADLTKAMIALRRNDD
jgi:hypothetical protein